MPVRIDADKIEITGASCLGCLTIYVLCMIGLATVVVSLVGLLP